MSKQYLKLSQILKQLLFEHNLKPIDLARQLAIPQPTIHRLVTGKSTRPYRSSLEPIADFFSISIEQLLGEVPLNNKKHHTQERLHDGQIKFIPLLTWSMLLTNDLLTAKNIGKKEVLVDSEISANAFALLMNDSSMEPLFPPNTLLILDPDKAPNDRSFVLVKLNGETFPVFRQLLIDIDHQFLKPLNSDSNFKMRLLHSRDTILACLIESRYTHSTSKGD